MTEYSIKNGRVIAKDISDQYTLINLINAQQKYYS